MNRCSLLFGSLAVVTFIGAGSAGVADDIAGTANRQRSANSEGSANSDPFAYCSRIGTIDKPSGGASPVPTVLAPYLARALGLSADSGFRPETYYWRCMNGAVYVCAVGANIPCDAKANRSKRNFGAEKYCQENREASVVPAYATGHGGIYAWSCSLGSAVRGKRMVKLDGRGYRIDIWHQVSRH
jgi:hypothetical protein